MVTLHAFKTGTRPVNHVVEPRLVAVQLDGEDVARHRRHVVFAAKLCGRHTPGEFMNGRSLLTDRASITLSLMARDGG